MENVPQLADHQVFGEFLECLAPAYHVQWSIVECSSLGIPQSRRRLVLLASRLGPSGLELSHPEDETPTVRATISGLPSLAAGEQDKTDPLHMASSLSPRNLQRIRASKPGGTWRDWDEELQIGLPPQGQRRHVPQCLRTDGVGRGGTNDYDSVLWLWEWPLRSPGARSRDLPSGGSDASNFPSLVHIRSGR